MKKSHPSVSVASGRTGFTLIELLVVISIIAVLATLSLGGIKAVLLAAKKTAAKNDMAQIQIGVKGFYTDYSKYPMPSSAAQGSGADFVYGPKPARFGNEVLFNILCPKTGVDSTENPRGTRYLQIAKAKDQLPANAKSGLDNVGAWHDPWGSPYVVFIDGDYSGNIDVSTFYQGSANFDTKPGVTLGVASIGFGVSTKKKSYPSAYDRTVDLISWQ